MKSRRPRVLVVYKRSNLDLYRTSIRTPAKPEALKRVFGRAHDAHGKTVLRAQTAMDKLGLDTTWIRRDELRAFDEKRFDFGVTIGGDGTLLSLATYVDDLPVLAVNSAPEDSIGFFAAAQANTVRMWLQRILDGEPAQPLARMAVTINGVAERPILNDVLVTHPSPAATTRLCMKEKGQRAEEQKNSGVWIAAPAGATAAIGSAGGEAMRLDEKRLQYLVREPYPRHHRYRFARGFIAGKQYLEIEARLPELSVFLDGWTTVRTLRFTEKVRFALHPKSLWLFGRDERRAKLIL